MSEYNKIPNVVIKDKKIEVYLEKFFKYITDKNLNLLLEKYGIAANNSFEDSFSDEPNEYGLIAEVLTDTIKRYVEINHYSSDEIANKFGGLLIQMGINENEMCILDDAEQQDFDDLSFKCYLNNSNDYINIIMKLHGVSFQSHFMGFIIIDHNGEKVRYKYESEDRFIDENFDKKISLTMLEKEVKMGLDKDMNISRITASNGINKEDSNRAFLDGIVIPRTDIEVNVVVAGQNNENNLSPNLEKYYKIITKYKNGDFSDEHLSLAEILDTAGESDLLNQMSISEIQYLIDNSSGITKMIFSEVKKQKSNSGDYIGCNQFGLSRERKKFSKDKENKE